METGVNGDGRWTGVDGECCTLWLEHVSFVHYSGYAERLPQRFRNALLVAPWGGWRVDEAVVAKGVLYPAWMQLAYPPAGSGCARAAGNPSVCVSGTDAQQLKWHVATFVQSAYRAYTAIRGADGTSFRNLLQESNDCGERLRDTSTGACATGSGGGADTVFASLTAAQQAHYT